MRVSRLLAWIWTNYLEEQLEARYIPGELNKCADMLSRWKVESQCEWARKEKETAWQEGERKGP